MVFSDASQHPLPTTASPTNIETTSSVQSVHIEFSFMLDLSL